MATRDVRETDAIDGSGLRIVVIRTRWNPEIIDRLASGVDRALADLGVTDVETVEVPGAFEIPFAARTIARSGRVDALVAIGAVIRGETSHYELVSEHCARGLQDVQIATGIPIGFGVLATENLEQALARSEDAAGHGADGAAAGHGADGAAAGHGADGAAAGHGADVAAAGHGADVAAAGHNVGEDAARVAVEMALLARTWS